MRGVRLGRIHNPPYVPHTILPWCIIQLSEQARSTHTRAATISPPTKLKSSLLDRSNDLGGYCFGPVKDLGLSHLGPTTNQAQMLHLANLLATRPFPTRGYIEQRRIVQTSCNVRQRLSTHNPANISSVVTLLTIS